MYVCAPCISLVPWEAKEEARRGSGTSLGLLELQMVVSLQVSVRN